MPRARGPEPAEEIRRLGLVRKVHHRQRCTGHTRQLLHEGRLTRAGLTHEQHRLRHLHGGGDPLQDSHRVARLCPPPVVVDHVVTRGENRPPHRDSTRAALHGGFVEDVGVLGDVGAEAPASRHGLEHPPPTGTRGEHTAQNVGSLLVRRSLHLRRERVRLGLTRADQRELRPAHLLETPGPSKQVAKGERSTRVDPRAARRVGIGERSSLDG